MWGIPLGLIIKVAAGAAILAFVVGGFLWIRADAREEGRQEIIMEVQAAARGQKDRVSAATVKALESINVKEKRQLKIYAEAIKEIGDDCRVDPGVISAFERLRQVDSGTRPN